MEALGAKIVSIISLFILSMFFGLVPMKVRTYFVSNSKQAWISVLLCFGAGVLFSTAFLHLLPEANEYFNELFEELEEKTGKKFDYHFCELSVCLGFLMIYFLESSFHSLAHKQHNPEIEIKLAEIKVENGTASLQNQTYPQISASQQSTSPVIEVPYSNAINNNSCTEECEENAVEKEGTSLLRSVMVVFALSFHGCFEGLALGLEDTAPDVWLMFLTMSCHKCVIAFSLGMELLEVEIKKVLFYIHIACFALASPIGAIIGTALVETEMQNSSGFAIATLQGIACGTIIYIIFCEVLERERPKPGKRLTKFFAFLIGFVIIAVLQIFDHDGDDGEDTVTEMTSTPQSINFNNPVQNFNHWNWIIKR